MLEPVSRKVNAKLRQAISHVSISRWWEARALWEKQNGRRKKKPSGRTKIDLN